MLDGDGVLSMQMSRMSIFPLFVCDIPNGFLYAITRTLLAVAVRKSPALKLGKS